MRKTLLTVMCALFAIFPALSDTYSANFANLLSDCNEKYNSGGPVANIPSITNQIFTITLSQGTNTNSVQKPRWYNTGTKGFAFFADNTMNIKLNGPGSITKITFTGASATYTVGLTASTGTVTKQGDTELVWTGDASEVTLTGTGINRFTAFAMDYTAQLPISDAPVINPGSGTYVGPLSVTISAKEGATIYYTTDGTAPTTESTVFDGTPISFPSRWNSTTNPYQVKAIAVEPGNDPSIIVSASYAVLDGITCYSLADFNRRSFDMIPGTGDPSTLYQFNGEYTVVYQNGPIIYITDGTDGLRLSSTTAPAYTCGDVIKGFSGTFYCAAPFTPQLNCSAGSLTEPIRHDNFSWPVAENDFAIAKVNMSQPYVLENVYVDTYKAESSDNFRLARFSNGGGEVILYNAFSNLSVFDYAVPMPEHPSYYNVYGFVGSDSGGGEGTSTSTGILCFIPTDFVAADVEVTTPPTISPNGGEYMESVNVSIVVPTGTTVYYTTDGSAPTKESTKYTEPFTLTRSGKVRAVAMADGKFPSIIVEADFTVLVKSEEPVFSPVAGTYYKEVEVTLTAPDPDAYIYYTLDGTEPDAFSKTYLAPFNITETTTVKAIAVSFDQLPSTVVEATYVITDEMLQTDAPVFTPAAGTYKNEVEVSIAASDGAQVYYTLDGTEPGTNALLYTAPFKLTETTLVKAIAVEEGMVNSEIVEAIYTIEKNNSITTISIDSLDANAIVFDLTGRRVNTANIVPGFYIIVSEGAPARVALK